MCGVGASVFLASLSRLSRGREELSAPSRKSVRPRWAYLRRMKEHTFPYACKSTFPACKNRIHGRFTVVAWPDTSSRSWSSTSS
jgi:hypothetical protein